MINPTTQYLGNLESGYKVTLFYSVPDREDHELYSGSYGPFERLEDATLLLLRRGIKADVRGGVIKYLEAEK